MTVGEADCAVKDLPITLSYNSSVFGSQTPSAVTGGTGSGWAITGFDQRLVANADSSVTYYGPAGLSGVFAPNGTGNYLAPPQFQATLTGSSTAGWTLTDHDRREQLTFSTSGRLQTDKDRNGNAVTYGYDPYGLPASITSSRGPEAGRKVTVTTSGGRITTLTQTSATLTRSVTLGYTSLGHLSTVAGTDTKVTVFDTTVEGSSGGSGPDTGEVLRIVNPAGKATYLTFTSAPKKVASVSQVQPADRRRRRRVEDPADLPEQHADAGGRPDHQPVRRGRHGAAHHLQPHQHPAGGLDHRPERPHPGPDLHHAR